MFIASLERVELERSFVLTSPRSPGDFQLNFLLSRKLQSHAVHAIAQAGWLWTIVENVSYMSVALRAKDLSSCFSQRPVDLFTHVLFSNRLPKTRPSGA